MKTKVLFVCVHNSARSQMAEAFLNRICPEEFEAHSAGLQPGKLNPVVVEAMREVGIDIPATRPRRFSICSSPANCFRMSSRFAMKRAPNVVRFFPA